MSKPKIISMSLYGNGPVYTKGAIANAHLLPEIYPDWTLRIYCCVHDNDITELQKLGCEIYAMSRTRLHSGMFWRFLAAWDKEAERVIFRDADSRFNVREAAAVKAWEGSGTVAHCISDHPHHRILPMSGGMWGIKCGFLPEKLYRTTLVMSRRRQPRVSDMHFLRDHIHPLVKNSLLRHSSVPSKWPSVPFPPHPTFNGFVGQQHHEDGSPIWPMT